MIQYIVRIIYDNDELSDQHVIAESIDDAEIQAIDQCMIEHDIEHRGQCIVVGVWQKIK